MEILAYYTKIVKKILHSKSGKIREHRRRSVQGLTDLHGQLHGGAVVLRRAPAMVGVDIAHRDADDDAGHALGVDHAAVGAAAGADGFLHGDAVGPG